MQRVFFRLQTSDKAIETGELTRSFGWDSSESFMQVGFSADADYILTHHTA